MRWSLSYTPRLVGPMLLIFVDSTRDWPTHESHNCGAYWAHNEVRRFCSGNFFACLSCFASRMRLSVWHIPRVPFSTFEVCASVVFFICARGLILTSSHPATASSVWRRTLDYTAPSHRARLGIGTLLSGHWQLTVDLGSPRTSRVSPRGCRSAPPWELTPDNLVSLEEFPVHFHLRSCGSASTWSALRFPRFGRRIIAFTLVYSDSSMVRDIRNITLGAIPASSTLRPRRLYPQPIPR